MKARARRALGIGLEASDLAAATTGGAGRFLGRLDLSDLRRELAEAGVLSALAARGYEGPRIRIAVEDGEHRLVVAPAEGDESLIDLRMTEGTLSEQGRFEALVRDLGHLPVAEASAFVDEGRVVEETTGKPALWAPGSMLAALGRPVRECMGSAEYVRAAAAAREAHRFRVA